MGLFGVVSEQLAKKQLVSRLCQHVTCKILFYARLDVRVDSLPSEITWVLLASRVGKIGKHRGKQANSAILSGEDAHRAAKVRQAMFWSGWSNWNDYIVYVKYYIVLRHNRWRFKIVRKVERYELERGVKWLVSISSFVLRQLFHEYLLCAKNMCVCTSVQLFVSPELYFTS